MRAVIYIRVSTEEQAREGYSIEAQREVCLRWILEKGHTLVDEYIDEGYSAKNLKRKDIQRMIKDIPEKKFDLLVFWRQNRLTRILKDKIYLYELFNDHRIELKSMTEEIDTTSASGRMVTNILVSVAQGELEQISENVHSTMYELALKGKRNGAAAPIGYDLVEKELVVNEQEAELVKSMFEFYLQNRSIRWIAKTFNRNPHLYPHPKQGMWNDFTVYYILTNPVYIGQIRWNNRKSTGKLTGKEITVQGTHMPILDKETFDRAQKLMEMRSQKGKAATSDYAFTGVLVCERCSKPMHGTSRKVLTGRKRAYKCSGRFNLGMCDMPLIAEESVEEAFFESLDYNIEQYAALLKQEPMKLVRETNTQADIIRKDLEQIEKRKKKWQFAFANDAITIQDLKLRMSEEDDLEKRLNEQLKKIDTPKQSLSYDEIIDQLKSIKDSFSEIKDQTAKKMFINDLFETITINTKETEAKGGPGRRVRVYVSDFEFNS
jgi:site-specific DNA recombinase